MWCEWQDRRNQIRGTIESLQEKHETHITNLDAALAIIAQIGIVYNALKRDDQKELLRQMVERVVINPEGKVVLELRAPFAYLQDISDQVRGSFEIGGNQEPESKKAVTIDGPARPNSSTKVSLCGEDRIRTCGTL